ncbi:tellurium resistance protein TerD [Pseudonocardia sp. N23]|nr:tellurium resistance protein TerD [Pseudonocardia sp. N23]
MLAYCVFFNNPTGPGVTLTATTTVAIDLAAVPADVDRVLVTASTEAQGARFGDAAGAVADIRGSDELRLDLGGLTTETVVQVVALYRRGAGWRLDAIAQGYTAGLAALAEELGIDVGDDGPAPVAAAPAAAVPDAPAPAAPAAPAVSFEKVRISLAKDAPDKTARIDLRKSGGEPGWVLTVGLEWDGRGARYGRDGAVKKYGTGDLDVYFFCRNEVTGEYVVISGEQGHRGSLEQWPHVHHLGDSLGPGGNGRPATEQVRMTPTENGDILVNVYQSVDNGAGAIDTFGRPRVAVRYGRAGADGLPGPDADEIVVEVGNGRNSFWATVAHIDVEGGVLSVDGETRYSAFASERMPGLDTAGHWVRKPKDGPVGRSKKANGGVGLTRYDGMCPPA